MTWIRLFSELCIVVYAVLQCMKTNFLSSKPMPAMWESVARVTLIVNPILFFLLFLHEPQTLPVLLFLIGMHILLAADWIVTYLSLSEQSVDGNFTSLIRNGYIVYLILKALTTAMLFG